MLPKVTWPRLKKARCERHTLVFMDQTSFMLQPPVHQRLGCYCSMASSYIAGNDALAYVRQ
jgi:hypothetical protein